MNCTRTKKSSRLFTRTIAWIMILCMVIGLMPGNIAYAADEGNNSILVKGNVYLLTKNGEDEFIYAQSDRIGSNISSGRNLNQGEDIYFICDSPDVKADDGPQIIFYFEEDNETKTDSIKAMPYKVDDAVVTFKDGDNEYVIFSECLRSNSDGRIYTGAEIITEDNGGENPDPEYGTVTIKINNSEGGNVNCIPDYDYNNADGVNWGQNLSNNATVGLSEGVETIYVRCEAFEGWKLEEGLDFNPQKYYVDGTAYNLEINENGIASISVDVTKNYEINISFVQEQSQDPGQTEKGSLRIVVNNTEHGSVTQYSVDNRSTWNTVSLNQTDGGMEYNIPVDSIPDDGNLIIKCEPAEGYRAKANYSTSANNNPQDISVNGDNEVCVDYNLSNNYTDIHISFEEDNGGGDEPGGDDPAGPSYGDTEVSSNITVSEGSEAEFFINGVDGFTKEEGYDNEGYYHEKIIPKETVTYKYDSEKENPTVEIKFASHIELRYTEIKINDTDYSANIPGYGLSGAAKRNDILKHTEGGMVVFSFEIPFSETYNITAKRVEIGSDADDDKDNAADYVAVGNFKWSNKEQDKDTDFFLDNTTLEFVSFTYTDFDEEGKETKVTFDSVEDLNAADISYLYFDGDKDYGETLLPAGGTLTVKLIPGYGYQVVKFGPNNKEFETGDEIGTYTFEIGAGNFHLGAECAPVDDKAKIGEGTNVNGASVDVADDEFQMGTAVLTVNEAESDENRDTEFIEQAGEEYELLDVLDISIANVVYKGTDKDAWETECDELESPAVISLGMDNIAGKDIIIIHETHDEKGEVTGYEKVEDASIDDDGNIVFSADSFSSFGVLVSEETDPNVYFEIENLFEEKEGVITVEGAQLIDGAYVVPEATQTVKIKCEMVLGYEPVMANGEFDPENWDNRFNFKEDSVVYNARTKKTTYVFEIDKKDIANKITVLSITRMCYVDVRLFSDVNTKMTAGKYLTVRNGSKIVSGDNTENGTYVYPVVQGQSLIFTFKENDDFKLKTLYSDAFPEGKQGKAGTEYTFTVTDNMYVNAEYTPQTRIEIINSDGFLVCPVKGVYNVNRSCNYSLIVKYGGEYENLTENSIVGDSVNNGLFRIARNVCTIYPVYADKTEVELEVKTEHLGSAKIKLNIPNIPSSATIKGSKNNVITVPLNSRKVFDIIYPKGTDSTVCSLMFDSNREIFQYIFSDDRSKLTIIANKDDAGVLDDDYEETIRIAVPGENDVPVKIAEYKVKIDTSYIKNCVPAVTVSNISIEKNDNNEDENVIYLKATAPKSMNPDTYDYDKFSYEVFVVNKGSNPDNEASVVYSASFDMTGDVIRIASGTLEMGKTYDIYVRVHTKNANYNSDFKKVSVTTKQPYYETKLTLKQKVKEFYPGFNYENGGANDVVIAEVGFSKNTSYYGLNAELVNMDRYSEAIYYSGNDDDAVLTITDTNKIVVRNSKYITPGNYVLNVYSDQGDNNAATVVASCNIKVKPCVNIASLTGVPEKIYKKAGTAVSFSVKPVFEESNPTSKKVTYEIKSSSQYVLDNVSIDKNGKVTISKNFMIYGDENDSDNIDNYFWIVVTPEAGEIGHFERKEYYSSQRVYITSEPLKLSNICINGINDETVKTADIDGKIVEVFDKYGEKIDSRNLKFTSSSKLVVIDSDGKITVKGVVPGGVTIKADSLDGGKSSVSLKIKIVYASYNQLAVNVNDNTDIKSSYDNEYFKYECFNVNVGFAKYNEMSGSNSFGSLNDMTNYSISVSGAKLIEAVGTSYYYIPTSKTSTVTLIDKTKKSNEQFYKQTFTINNKYFDKDDYGNSIGRNGSFKQISNEGFYSDCHIAYGTSMSFEFKVDGTYVSAGNICRDDEYSFKYCTNADLQSEYRALSNILKITSVEPCIDSRGNTVKGKYRAVVQSMYDVSDLRAGSFKFIVPVYSEVNDAYVLTYCDLTVKIANAPAVGKSNKPATDKVNAVSSEGSVAELPAIKLDGKTAKYGEYTSWIYNVNVKGVISDYAQYFEVIKDEDGKQYLRVKKDIAKPENLSGTKLVVPVGISYSVTSLDNTEYYRDITLYVTVTFGE